MDSLCLSWTVCDCLSHSVSVTENLFSMINNFCWQFPCRTWTEYTWFWEIFSMRFEFVCEQRSPRSRLCGPLLTPHRILGPYSHFVSSHCCFFFFTGRLNTGKHWKYGTKLKSFAKKCFYNVCHFFFLEISFKEFLQAFLIRAYFQAWGLLNFFQINNISKKEINAAHLQW